MPATGELLPCITESCTAPCCDVHEVPLLDRDVQRLADATGRAPDTFVDEAEGWRMLKGAGVADAGCVFLGTVRPGGRPVRGCTAHDARPEACRNYPFVLQKDGPRPVVKRDDVCPYRDAFADDIDVPRRLNALWDALQAERRARLADD